MPPGGTRPKGTLNAVVGVPYQKRGFLSMYDFYTTMRAIRVLDKKGCGGQYKKSGMKPLFGNPEKHFLRR
jgi:hypothetical protein